LQKKAERRKKPVSSRVELNSNKRKYDEILNNITSSQQNKPEKKRKFNFKDYSSESSDSGSDSEEGERLNHSIRSTNNSSSELEKEQTPRKEQPEPQQQKSQQPGPSRNIPPHPLIQEIEKMINEKFDAQNKILDTKLTNHCDLIRQMINEGSNYGHSSASGAVAEPLALQMKRKFSFPITENNDFISFLDDLQNPDFYLLMVSTITRFFLEFPLLFLLRQ
jgi:hypothetical protein